MHLILMTNTRASMNDAFLARFGRIVRFSKPSGAERRRIWLAGRLRDRGG
jgi:SpoVK/Ycf46/Vps4 family AAA+-type ATPase